MATPLISIVMPAYNHEAYIGEAIASVITQTYSNYELIVVNDGSTDGTEGVIRGFSDDRIRYYSQKNADAYNAINRGIALATGKYISILNSDDIYHPDRLAKLLDVAECSQARFFFTLLRLVDEHGNEVTHRNSPALRWYNSLLNVYKQTVSLTETLRLGNVTVTTSNFFFKKELVEEMEGFRPFRYAHDYDFVLRSFFSSPTDICFLADSTLLDYRVHSANTIHNALEQTYRERFRILLDLMEKAAGQEQKAVIASFLQTLYEEMVTNWQSSSQTVSALHDSLSWRLTGILRSIAGILRRG
ncbi:glycosyltransferase family 2 protein [Geotalea toluenoxydans]|uniref:glycosyltransferase family 2 protein n=1 Tax=Geotalea toluenoxydans TaxID=421624 RepID=UPI0006D10504|nr:glycosyltransferase [Geotalea toluenoxydans]